MQEYADETIKEDEDKFKYDQGVKRGDIVKPLTDEDLASGPFLKTSSLANSS